VVFLEGLSIVRQLGYQAQHVDSLLAGIITSLALAHLLAQHLERVDELVIVKVALGALVYEDAHKDAERHLVVLASALDGLLVIDGPHLVLHAFDFEFARVLAQRPENVGHLLDWNAVSQDPSLLGLLPVEVVGIFVVVFVGGVTQLGLLELVLHVLLEVVVTHHLNQLLFLGNVQQALSQLQLTGDGTLVDLPDLDAQVFAPGGEDESLLGLDAERAEEGGVRHNADVFGGVSVDRLLDHADDAVLGGEDLELVVLVLVAFLPPERLDAALPDLPEVWALLGVLETVLLAVEELDLEVTGGNGQQVFLELGLVGDALGFEVPLDPDGVMDDAAEVFEAGRVELLLDQPAVVADGEEAVLLVFLLGLHFSETEVGQEQLFVAVLVLALDLHFVVLLVVLAFILVVN